MLFERQRNIVVELTLAGRTAQYIADSFDCSVFRGCEQTCQNIVRKPSWFCRKHIWRHKSSIRVSTCQCSCPQGASNSRMVGTAGRIHHSMAIAVPDLNIIEQVWDFTGREMVPGWTSRGPYLHNLYNSLPKRVRVVIKGRGYPTKYWLTKYIH